MTTKPKARKCVWKWDGSVGTYAMSCLPNADRINADSWWTFCPNCGRRIERKK